MSNNPNGATAKIPAALAPVQPGPAKEAVNHPAHYAGGGHEVIDVIEAWELNFHKGTALKYIGRAGKKDPTKYVEDIEKAIWYLQREIERYNRATAK